MERGLHMGMVNVILPLSEAGRNHLLATYIIKGKISITRLRVLENANIKEKISSLFYIVKLDLLIRLFTQQL